LLARRTETCVHPAELMFIAGSPAVAGNRKTDIIG
jgi:hypothetical protein